MKFYVYSAPHAYSSARARYGNAVRYAEFSSNEEAYKWFLTAYDPTKYVLMNQRVSKKQKEYT